MMSEEEAVPLVVVGPSAGDKEKEEHDKKKKGEEEEEEEEEAAWRKEPISVAVEAEAAKLGQSEEAVSAVVEVMRANWVQTLGDWDDVRSSGMEVARLPARLAAALDKRLASKKEAPPVEGPTKEQIRSEPIYNQDPEDAEQNRVVLELAEAFEKGEINKVVTKVFLNKLENLSTADWTVTFDIGIQCWFLSEYHVNWHDDMPDMEKVFKPDFEFVGAIEVEPIVCPDEGGSFYIRDRYKRYGIINWYQRYRGTVKQDLKLDKFPFDSQRIAIRFGMTLYGAEDVLLLNRTDPAVVASFDARVDELHEWGIGSKSEIQELLVFNDEDKRDISYLEYSVTVNRLGVYYLQNVFLMVYFLNVLTWWLFLIDPNTLNDRLQICITAFLALVAFNFVVAETLPKINHSTHLTHYFAINYGVITLGAIESGVSFLVDKYLSQDNFITAKIIDWTTMGIVAVLQTIVLVVYAVMAKRHR